MEEEWFEVEFDGHWHAYRFDDFAGLCEVPGLYEAWTFEMLGCPAPAHLTRLLQVALRAASSNLRDLRILDLWAGNGLIGESLKTCGASYIVGIDELPEATRAVVRDRPAVYNAYFVGKLSGLEQNERAALDSQLFDCLTISESLRLDVVPPQLFVDALRRLKLPGWIAVLAREDVLQSAPTGGFGDLLHRMIQRSTLRVEARSKTRRLKGISSGDVCDVALVTRKMAEPAWDEKIG